MRFWVLTTLAALVLAAGCGGKNATLRRVGPEDLLQRAERHLEKGDELRAIEELTKLTIDYPGVAFIDRVVFLLGTAHLEAEEYAEAEINFQRLGRDYPFSEYADDAMYYEAETYFRQVSPPWGDPGPGEVAQRRFRMFLREFPDSPLADDARAKIRDIDDIFAEKLYLNARQYMRLSRPRSAIIYAQSLLDRYPESNVAPRATLLMADARADTGDLAGACAALDLLIDGPRADDPALLGEARQRRADWACGTDGVAQDARVD